MAEQYQTLSLVLALVRDGRATTRPELMRETDLGRGVINQRVADAIAAGLLVEADEGISTGGRPSPALRLDGRSGVVLTAVFSATRLDMAVVDLTGRVCDSRTREWTFEQGPEAALQYVLEVVEELAPNRDRLWAVTLGFPVPVDLTSGTPIFGPTAAGWRDFPVRTVIEERLGVPAYIDTAVNLKALGLWHDNRDEAGDDLLFIEADIGLGAAVLSRGELLRGAHGVAGEFGHVAVALESRVQCRCGNYGCIEALAGGWALERDAFTTALIRGSDWLQARISDTGHVSMVDIVLGSRQNDPLSVELLGKAGALIGAQLASLISLLNPSTVFVGGEFARAGAVLIAPMEEAVARRVLPAVSDELAFRATTSLEHAAAVGAAAIAINDLLTPRMLGRWVPAGSPRGQRADVAGTVVSPRVRPDERRRDESDTHRALSRDGAGPR